MSLLGRSSIVSITELQEFACTVENSGRQPCVRFYRDANHAFMAEGPIATVPKVD